MVDVARLAGVSQSTVSFVLNDRRDVSVATETRRRVLEAARQLGFRPNRMAQELRLNKSFTFGVVTNGIASHPYAGRTLLGIQQAAGEAGYVCMVIDIAGDPGIEDDAVANLLDRGVAGVIWAAPSPVEIRPSRHLHDVRTVFANCWPTEGYVTDAILLPAEYEGGLAAGRAVFDRGHRDVAFLGGTGGEWATVHRERGFVDAARAAKVDPERLLRVHGDYGTDSGYELTKELFSRSRPTALVCGNDRMALGGLLALYELGYRVPDDVSLVGYDDQENFASQLHPRLTTVALPHFEIGLRAGQILSASIEAGSLGEEFVDCRLIERDSVRTL